MSNKFYVYIDTFENGTKYVGKGKGNRAFSTIGRNAYWKNLLNKYGNPRVFIIKSTLSEDASFELEKEIIKIMKEALIPVCNITNGGEGQSGMIGDKSFWFGKNRDSSTCSKISKSLSGENHPNYGMSLSKSTRDKIGDKHRGKKVSETTRKLLVERGKERELTGSRNPAYLSDAHKFIHDDHGTIEATQYYLYTTYGLSKSAICCVVSRKRTSHKGWRLA